MSKLILFICFGCIVFSVTGCKTVTENIISVQSCDCPIPKYSNGHYKRPAVGYTSPQISPDGKSIVYITNNGAEFFQILDLKTLKIETILLKDILPDTLGWKRETEVLGIFWCPYSSDKLFLDCYTYPTSFSTTYGKGYIYNRTSKQVAVVSPSKFGKYGQEGGSSLRSWLRGSKEGFDSILTDTSIYLIQQDSMYPRPTGYRENLVQSLHTSDNITSEFNNYYGIGDRYINNSYFVESRSLAYGSFRWSPNAKKIVVSAFPLTPPTNQYGLTVATFAEVWIIDRENINTGENYAAYTLNFQQLFCTYNGWGPNAEYISDSTLVVSMHKADDEISQLWEITDKGKIVRQLTK